MRARRFRGVCPFWDRERTDLTFECQELNANVSDLKNTLNLYNAKFGGWQVKARRVLDGAFGSMSNRHIQGHHRTLRTPRPPPGGILVQRMFNLGARLKGRLLQRHLT